MSEHPPSEGHEKSNREAEREVGMIAGHARTLREFVEFHRGRRILDNHPLLAWLVDYCGTLITLFSNGEPTDGMTPLQRMKGKPWRIAVPPWGEKIEYKRRSKDKWHGRCRPGILPGVKRETTERICGDAEGGLDSAERQTCISRR